MRHLTSLVLAGALLSFGGVAMAKDVAHTARPHAEQMKKKGEKKPDEKKPDEKKPDEGGTPAPQGGAGGPAPQG